MQSEAGKAQGTSRATASSICRRARSCSTQTKRQATIAAKERPRARRKRVRLDSRPTSSLRLLRLRLIASLYRRPLDYCESASWRELGSLGPSRAGGPPGRWLYTPRGRALNSDISGAVGGRRHIHACTCRSSLARCMARTRSFSRSMSAAISILRWRWRWRSRSISRSISRSRSVRGEAGRREWAAMSREREGEATRTGYKAVTAAKALAQANHHAQAPRMHPPRSTALSLSRARSPS